MRRRPASRAPRRPQRAAEPGDYHGNRLRIYRRPSPPERAQGYSCHRARAFQPPWGIRARLGQHGPPESRPAVGCGHRPLHALLGTEADRRERPMSDIAVKLWANPANLMDIEKALDARCLYIAITNGRWWLARRNGATRKWVTR